MKKYQANELIDDVSRGSKAEVLVVLDSVFLSIIVTRTAEPR
jgi:hypothetical protein